MGPLCALCDVDAGYATVNGDCAVCPSKPVSVGSIVLVALLFVAAIAYLVLRKAGDEASRAAAAGESIALRILLTHVQALAALRAFRATGSSLFRALTVWTDALTPALLTEGPSSCVLTPTFASTFFGTLTAPLMATAVGLFILAAAAVHPRRNAVLQRRPSVISSAGGSAAAATSASSQRPVAASNSLSASGAAERLRGMWRSREAERVLVVVQSLSHMSVVSACISALDCSEEIDGVRYLRADYRVECRGSGYASIAAVAVLILLAVGAGFPLLIFLRLRHVTAAALTQQRFAAWSFLFLGYRVPASPSSAEVGMTKKRAAASAAPGEPGSDEFADEPVAMTANPVAALRAAGATVSNADAISMEPAGAGGD